MPGDPGPAPEDDAPAPDEEVLQTGGRTKRRRTRRLREELLLAALILAGVLAVGRAMSADNGKSNAPPTAGPTSSAGSHGPPDPGSGLLNGSVLTYSPTDAGVTVPGLPSRGPGDPTRCPTGHVCVAEDRAGAPAIAALLDIFPDAVLQSATTINLKDPDDDQPLLFRQMNARLGATRILVRVQRQLPGDAPRQGVSADGDRAITYFEGALSRYHVVVQVDSPKTVRQPIGALEILARDVRLLGGG
jgi:hypothetical protein